ncbi:hypothetical protein R5R35_011792 [Gryllus longicercus]|uniref:IGFBP N-terminal domain-containing protein n=1 Tax=Gryllus longicercus TaxID=2509291 RepID=A0AAN9VSX5_9ORTH
MLVTAANAEEDMEYSPIFPRSFHPGIIPCLPKKDCSTVLCKRICPEDCPSGRTIRCGCCDVCLVELECGEQCRFFVPNNARCGPGLRCGSYGQCEYKPGFLPGVPAPGYPHRPHCPPRPRPPHCLPPPPPRPPRCHRHPPPQKCTC